MRCRRRTRRWQALEAAFPRARTIAATMESRFPTPEMNRYSDEMESPGVSCGPFDRSFWRKRMRLSKLAGPRAVCEPLEGRRFLSSASTSPVMSPFVGGGRAVRSFEQRHSRRSRRHPASSRPRSETHGTKADLERAFERGCIPHQQVPHQLCSRRVCRRRRTQVDRSFGIGAIGHALIAFSPSRSSRSTSAIAPTSGAKHTTHVNAWNDRSGDAAAVSVLPRSPKNKQAFSHLKPQIECLTSTTATSG